MQGFFLASSGGIDSCATALIVYSMCQIVYAEILEKNLTVIKDVEHITGHSNYSNPRDLCQLLITSN